MSGIQICTAHIEDPETVVYTDNGQTHRNLQARSRPCCSHTLHRQTWRVFVIWTDTGFSCNTRHKRLKRPDHEGFSYRNHTKIILRKLTAENPPDIILYDPRQNAQRHGFVWPISWFCLHLFSLFHNIIRSRRRRSCRWLTLAERVVEVARCTLVALVTPETTPAHTVTCHQITWPIQTAGTWALTGCRHTHTYTHKQTNIRTFS